MTIRPLLALLFALTVFFGGRVPSANAHATDAICGQPGQVQQLVLPDTAVSAEAVADATRAGADPATDWALLVTPRTWQFSPPNPRRGYGSERARDVHVVLIERERGPPATRV